MECRMREMKMGGRVNGGEGHVFHKHQLEKEMADSRAESGSRIFRLRWKSRVGNAIYKCPNVLKPVAKNCRSHRMTRGMFSARTG